MMGKRNRHRLPSFVSLKSPLVLQSVNREIHRFSSCRTMGTHRLFAKHEYYVAIIKSVQQVYDCAVKEDVLDRLLYYISTQRTNSDKKTSRTVKDVYLLETQLELPARWGMTYYYWSISTWKPKSILPLVRLRTFQSNHNAQFLY